MKKLFGTIVLIVLLSSFTTFNQNISLRRTIKPGRTISTVNNWTPIEVEQYRIIGLLDRLEKGTFDGNGREEILDAYNSTLNFLANTETPWEMKRNILTRINALYVLLPQELKTLFTQELQRLDELAYEQGRAAVLSQVANFSIPEPALHIPINALPANILVENALLFGLDRRQYSRYLGF